MTIYGNIKYNEYELMEIINIMLELTFSTFSLIIILNKLHKIYKGNISIGIFLYCLILSLLYLVTVVGIFYYNSYIQKKNIILKIIDILLSCISETFALVTLYYVLRKRIFLSEEIMKTTLISIKKHPSILLLSLIPTFSSILVNSIIVTSAYGMVAKYENNEKNGSGTMILIILFLLFSYYFINEIIKNIIHVSISGTTAFFLKWNKENHPIIKSFIRAMTKRFGSICFGSIVNSLIKQINNLLIVESYTL